MLNESGGKASSFSVIGIAEPNAFRARGVTTGAAAWASL
jgi:hypothetical protein